MAGYIPEGVIQEILQKVNIVEVIGEYVTLKRVGRGYHGICPFHQDSKPSFHVNEERGFFHCFGCGAGGNAFHFLMKHLHMSFPEAARSLAGRYGVTIPQHRPTPSQRRRLEERELLLELNKEALRFFRESLESRQGAAARQYLERRGFSREIVEAFELGYAPAQWRALSHHLKSRGFDLQAAQRAGLVISAKDGGYYDRFRGRLIFPIHDEAGRVVAFGGRALGEESPKYLNSPETAVFSKRRSLYGLFRAKGSIRDEDKAIVVEGYTDVMALHQHGVSNAIATLGTSITLEHLHMLRRFSSNVVHVFDADEAGQRATMRALDLCLDAGLWGSVLNLPQNEDPDTYVRKVGAKGFRDLLSRAIPLMDFLIERVLLNGAADTVEGTVRALDQIVPRLRRIQNPIVLDHYVGVLTERMQIREQRIRSMLRGGLTSSRQIAMRSEEEGRHRTERLIIQAILKDAALAKGLKSSIIKYFENEKIRSIAEAIGGWPQKEGNDLIDYLNGVIEDPEVGGLLAQLLDQMDEVEDPQRVFHDCLRHLKRMGVERELHALNERMKMAKENNDEEALRSLEKEKARLVTEKARLRMSSRL